MAAPQKELGYTPIAHGLLEALILWDGPGRVKDLVLAIMRETYGWSEKARVIPAWRLCQMLGVSDARVRQLRGVAVKCGLILVDGNTYEIQKDFDLWTTPDGNGVPADRKGLLRRGTYEEAPTKDPLRSSTFEEDDAGEGAPYGQPQGAPYGPPRTPPRGCKARKQDDSHDPSSEPAHDAGPDPAEPDQLDCTDQPSQPPAPKLTKKQQAAEKAAKREAELQAAIATVRADLPPELLPTLDAWLENLASHNESGTMTTGRVLSATTEFANLVHVHALTTAAIQHGVAAAIGAVDNKDGKDGVTAIRYVLSAAKGYGRDGARASPSDAPRGLPREEFILISDGTIRKASDWDLTQRWQVGEMKAAGNWDVETGRTLHPTPGYTCVDGFFYIDGTVENRVPNGRAGRVT